MIDHKKLLKALQNYALSTNPDTAPPFLNSIEDCLVFLVGIHKISPDKLAYNLSICSAAYIRNLCRSIGIPPLKRGGDRRPNSISSRLTYDLWCKYTAADLADMFNTTPAYIRYLAYLKKFNSPPPEFDEASLYTFD